MVDSLPGYDDALHVLQQLRLAGHEAYFAGGCVRDLLLGKQAKDYDVATNAQPNQVRKLFKNTQAVGAAFGVILVRHGGSTIEVATFRTDMEYQDGRRPIGVKFSTAQEDAQRRDFTINGLFLDPIENRIIDYVGGQADLNARIVRAIGNADERFAEDHLRMLRAVRFASRLQFAIEVTTASAIKSHAHELIRISPERIAEELRKMLMPVTRDEAFSLLQEYGLVTILMRFLPEKVSNHRHSALLLLCKDGAPFTFGLALAIITLDFRMQSSQDFDLTKWLSGPETKRSINAIRQALKISNDEAAEMSGALAWGQLLNEVPPSVALLKRFLQQPYSSEARRLMRGFSRTDLMPERISWLLGQLADLSRTDYAPLPLITGDDLTAAGAAPGPKFKLALDAAYDAQLEGNIHTAADALAIAKQWLRN